MNRFLHIDPKARTIAAVQAEEPYKAYEAVCEPQYRNTDHGTVGRGVAIIVFEFGLLEGEGPYFSIRGQLYSGDAILYAYDGHGDTVDMPEAWEPPGIQWFANKAEVELGIAAGVVMRPVAKINGVVTWTWK